MSMGIQEVLRLVVDADTRGAVRGVENLGRTAKRELSKSEKALDKWGNRLTNVGAGLIGLGAVALVGLGKAAMASEEAQLSVVKLENTIANMPKLAGESSKSFIDLANSLQEVTAADADAIVEAEALLGTFQLTADEITRITPLVVDFARKTGTDLPTAAVQVGKALDGNIGALKRTGISIDEAAFAADRFGAVHQALSDQVGGFAEAEGATFAGSLQRLRNELGDLAEGVGVGAVDAFSSMFSVVDGLTGRFNDLSPSTQSAIGKIATFGSVGLIAAGGVSIVVGQLIQMRKNLGAAVDATSALITKFGGLGNAARLLAGPTALLAVGVALDQYNKAEQSANVERLTDEFLAAGTSAAAMDEVLQSLAKQGVAETVGAFEKLASTNRAAAERFVDQMEAAGADSRVIEEMRGHLETTAAAQAQTAEDTGTATDAFGEEAGAIDGVTSSLQGMSDALQAQFDPVFALIDAQNQVADAAAGVAEATANVTAAEAEFGAGSPEHVAALEALREANLNVASAGVDHQSSLLNLGAAMLEQGGNIDDVIAHLQGMVGQNGITQQSVDTVAAALRDVPGQIDSTITAHDRASPTIASVGDALFNLNGREATVTIRQRVINDILSTNTFGLFQPRAHGGPVEAGQPYIVGEDRPELFIPDQNGTIMPSVPAMGSHAGLGGGSLVVTVNDNRTEVSLNGKVIAEALRNHTARNQGRNSARAR